MIRPMLKGFLGMLDPATRKATGYYAALGITLWDIHVHGFTQWNLVSVLLLSGVAAVSSLAELIHGKPAPTNGGETQATEDES